MCNFYNANFPFNSGDVVQLKSGGPPMTVGSYMPTGGGVSVLWFTPDEILKREIFGSDTLVHAPGFAKAEPPVVHVPTVWTDYRSSGSWTITTGSWSGVDDPGMVLPIQTWGQGMISACYNNPCTCLTDAVAGIAPPWSTYKPAELEEELWIPRHKSVSYLDGTHDDEGFPKRLGHLSLKRHLLNEYERV
jgi:uncharacterized protein YodC (DUF2158 family)